MKTAPNQDNKQTLYPQFTPQVRDKTFQNGESSSFTMSTGKWGWYFKKI